MSYPFSVLAAPPSGAASGALSGTYPGPGLVGASVATALAGQSVPNSGTTVFLNQVTLGNSLSNCSVDVASPGKGLAVAEGANAKQGTAVLVAGTVTVANTAVTANSRILLTSQLDGGTPGFLRVSARVAGTSFTITSSNGLDTSTVAFEIFEPG